MNDPDGLAAPDRQVEDLDVLAEQERIAGVYSALMEQVVIRLESMGRSLQEALENPAHPNSWQNAEFCYLQLRKICEYVALAVLAAHHFYDVPGRSKMEGEWHAASLFKKLDELNPYSFPLPINVLINHGGEGMHHVEPNVALIEPSEISSIYGRCGDRLHVGSLKTLVSGKLPPYDLNEISDWQQRLVKTLNTHMIRLPHVTLILLVLLKSQGDGLVHCAWAKAEGPFAFEGDATIFNVDRVH